MLTVVAAIHILICLLLSALVLLQDPKSGTSAVFGGGGSNSLLGATGAVTFLTKLTRYVAIIFGLTCIILTLMSKAPSGSVFDKGQASAPSAPAQQAPSAPAAPAAPADAAPAAPVSAPAQPAGQSK